jgi:hypothetical protein
MAVKHHLHSSSDVHHGCVGHTNDIEFHVIIKDELGKKTEWLADHLPTQT